MADFANKNYFEIIGTLTNVQVKSGVRKTSGHNYVNANAVIKSIIDGTENEFKVSFWADELTKKGEKNKNFIAYRNLDRDLKGRKVRVIGSLNEYRYKDKENHLQSSATLKGGRIELVGDEALADKAVFALDGFVTAPLYEKRNKKDELLGYRVDLAQADYTGEKMVRFTLDIDPQNKAILTPRSNIKAGETLTVEGNRSRVETTKTVEKKGGFGVAEPVTYINVSRSFNITWFDRVDKEHAYSSETVTRLCTAYKALQQEKQAEEGKSGNNRVAAVSATVEETDKAPARPTTGQASLV